MSKISRSPPTSPSPLPPLLARGALGLVMPAIDGSAAAAQAHRLGDVIGGDNVAQGAGPLAP